ncbi:transposon Tf2-9 polyprotein [Trichonephila clavipes]|nr:transposon Tf2-9 polyprotein [Trichonephila clavipes]
MKEGLIASSYECPKCNEQMGLNERKSVVLDGFEWRCQKKRTKVFKHTKAPLSTFALSDARFAHIPIDYIGPYPPSEGYKYCLTIIDKYTRWPEVIPTEDMLSETIARALLNGWISRFGTPDTIKTLSDQGTNFLSLL